LDFLGIAVLFCGWLLLFLLLFHHRPDYGALSSSSWLCLIGNMREPRPALRPASARSVPRCAPGYHMRYCGVARLLLPLNVSGNNITTPTIFPLLPLDTIQQNAHCHHGSHV
jgi:hypothetical protein